jgi:hypothetical protein
MISAASADGVSGSTGGRDAKMGPIGGAAERVCRKAKAQGYCLRSSRRHDAAGWLRVGGLALTSHCGINL